MKQFFVLVVLVMISSCATKYHASDVPVAQITNIAYFEPLSYIHYIEKGNKAIMNDSLSGRTRSTLDSLLTIKKSKFNIGQKIEIQNKQLQNRIDHEIGYLAGQIEKRRYIDGIPLTPTIDSILDSNGQRFGMVIVATGFGRAKGNFGGQVAKSLAVGILSMGMVVPTAVKSNIMLHGFILDAEKNDIAFYRKTVPAQKEPTDTPIIEKQLISLFEDYLYNDK